MASRKGDDYRPELAQDRVGVESLLESSGSSSPSIGSLQHITSSMRGDASSNKASHPLMEFNSILSASTKDAELSQRDPNAHFYKFFVRQQPLHARMCGFGEKDRRPLDPPPVVELQIHSPAPEPAGQLTQQHNTIHNPFFVVHCALRSSDGLQDRNLIFIGSGSSGQLPGSSEASSATESGSPDVEQQIQPPSRGSQSTAATTRVLMGNLVSGPSVLDDEFGKEGLFFYFPDLSIRTEGRFRLRFTLLQIDFDESSVESEFSSSSYTGESAVPSRQLLAECLSDEFTVYSAKKFPGMTESTNLTKAFARQGLKIPVRNETRGKKEQATSSATAHLGTSTSTSSADIASHSNVSKRQKSEVGS